MCRISALTATDIPRNKAALLFNDLMLRSNADAQPDGWGIYASDGSVYYKGGTPYFVNTSAWFRGYMAQERGELSSGIVIGHVRSASPNTARTIREAHPFCFLNDDQSTRFVGVHNGLITGTHEHYTYQTNDPAVDSFRAFATLYDMLGQDDLITPNFIDDWMSKFTDDSAFAIGIIRNNVLYLFRNEKRLLHAACIGNGYIINTSFEVLKGSAQFASEVLGVSISDPFVLEDHMLFEFTPGEKTVMQSRLGLALTPSRYGFRQSALPASSTATPQTNPPTSVTVVTVPATEGRNDEADDAGDDEVDSLWWDRVDAESVAMRAKRRIWNQIRELMNPARRGIVSLYVTSFVRRERIDDDFIGIDGESKLDPNWQSLTFEELIAARDHIMLHPLTGEQRHCINQWNRRVSRDTEVDEQVFAFGTVLFWHLPHELVTSYLHELSTKDEV